MEAGAGASPPSRLSTDAPGAPGGCWLPGQPLLGGQADGFFRGRLLAQICPPLHPCLRRGEVRVTCQLWGGVCRALRFQITSPHCPGFLLPRSCLIRKRTATATEAQNTEQQRPWAEQYPKPHQRGPFSVGFVLVQSRGVWGGLPAPHDGQGQRALRGPWFPQLFPPSGSPSLGGVNEWEVREGSTMKSQPRGGWKLFI